MIRIIGIVFAASLASGLSLAAASAEGFVAYEPSNPSPIGANPGPVLRYKEDEAGNLYILFPEVSDGEFSHAWRMFAEMMVKVVPLGLLASIAMLFAYSRITAKISATRFRRRSRRAWNARLPLTRYTPINLRALTPHPSSSQQTPLPAAADAAPAAEKVPERRATQERRRQERRRECVPGINQRSDLERRQGLDRRRTASL